MSFLPVHVCLLIMSSSCSSSLLLFALGQALTFSALALHSGLVHPCDPFALESPRGHISGPISEGISIDVRFNRGIIILNMSGVHPLKGWGPALRMRRKESQTKVGFSFLCFLVTET